MGSPLPDKKGGAIFRHGYYSLYSNKLNTQFKRKNLIFLKK